MKRIPRNSLIIVKRFNKFILLFGFLLSIVSPLVTPGFAQKPPDSPPDYVPGEILVKFQPHVDTRGAQRSLQSSDMRVAEVSPYSGVVRVQVEPGREQEKIDQLMARGDVEFASVNRYVYATFIPNDTSYGSQWALPKIEAPAAWDISTGGSNITIAIVDSGVDLDHPDLQANIIPGHDYVNNDSIPDDDYSHGTHVAGISAGIGNNSIGIAGVSWGAKIMPVKVLNLYGNGNQLTVSYGIKHARKNGAKIINLSLGGPKSANETCEDEYPDMSAEVKEALKDGVLVIASSGNNNGSVLCPAAMDGVIAVGSTDTGDNRSVFVGGGSNYGIELDISAPGSSIRSTVPPPDYVPLPSDPDDLYYYGYKSGTSMAAPYVSGLAALLWSVSPSLTKDQVMNIIQDNADDLYPSASDSCGDTFPSYVSTPGWDPCFGHGRINAWKSMQALTFQSSPSQLTLFVDDEKDQASGNVQVTTLSPNIITWTASISPTVSWLNIDSSPSGTLSAATSPDSITLLAQSTPLTYTDTPTTTALVITGTTASGAKLTTSSDVQLIYQSEIYEYYFPLIFKN